MRRFFVAPRFWLQVPSAQVMLLFGFSLLVLVTRLLCFSPSCNSSFFVLGFHKVIVVVCGQAGKAGAGQTFGVEDCYANFFWFFMFVLAKEWPGGPRHQR